MKRFIIITVILSLSWTSNAQQNILSKISNQYILSTNNLPTLTSINNFRSSNYLYPLETELLNNKAVYKISCKPTSTSPTIWGIIDIGFQVNQSGIKPIDEKLNNYIKILQFDSDDSEVIKEIVKTSTINGCYLIFKGGNTINFYVFSVVNQNRVTGTIEFPYGEIPEAQLKILAKDIIVKTIFK